MLARIRRTPRYALSVAAISAAALAVYAYACTRGTAGLVGSHSADVLYYGQLAARMRAGAVPYHTLFVEYPPGALPVFLAPGFWPHDYGDLFSILMAVCGGIALVAVAVAGRALALTRIELGRALLPLAVAPLLLGYVFLNRYDPWPMLLAALSLTAFVLERPRAGAAAFALAVLAKVYALASAPVLAAHVVRTAGGRALRRSTLVFAAVGVAGALPFAVVGPGGLGFSVYEQLTRNLEVESLGASLLVVAERLGLYRAHTIVGNLDSIDVVGSPATVVGIASTLVAFAALLVPAVLYLRGPADRSRFVLAFAAGIVGYVAFGKVLSAQYLVWLLPVVPLVRGRLGHAATALLALAMWLTNEEYLRLDSLTQDSGSLAFLVARNLALVLLYALLALGLRARPAESPAPVAVLVRSS